MNWKQADEFLQAADAPGIKPGLSRVREVLHLLGDPQDGLRFIHIAGTNGKGSVAVMLAGILRAAGYRTGLFTSPFLVRWNEQIRIDGEEIGDAELLSALDRVRDAVQKMEDPPSSFERFLPAAFLCFADAACDVVVLETGMGGRLDATNVIGAPEAVILTRIAMDHMNFLGNHIEAIAEAKAGIIKPGTDVVLVRQSEAVERVIRVTCSNTGAHLQLTDPAQLKIHRRSISGQIFSYRQRADLKLTLAAVWQTENASAVLDTVDVLRKRGWKIPEAAVRIGLGDAVWPGRFEVLLETPLVLLDGAHNENGAGALADSLAELLPGRKITFVMGVLADKEHGKMLRVLAPLAKRFITTAPDSPRALPAAELLNEIRQMTKVPAEYGGTMEESIRKAFCHVQEDGSEDGAICIFGSLYQAGAARKIVLDLCRNNEPIQPK